ncbi:MAG: hypothetical protein F6K22_30850 [Okeania sp. SIO2F4]|uniref:hypothetical protein n=1 Tax=Okeania sp. SIO2F4 TaxID=2607790 RepID=UPI001428E868|nr:hypothetical protein [Okeania sp. SIO2F4]MDJ0519087.1 hypothetical protein [Trichodesmium sp. MO_231.B1]NES06830.1 hypothetical protein [Okeania sp. SIO2F4]
MSKLDPDQEATSVSKDILKRINSLKKENERLYNILAIDVWALAKTMDEFHPGFWAAFMKNRDKALKKFMADTIKNKQKDDSLPPFLR